MFDLLGIAPATAALFVGFGLLVGILFGFFGMGGSFLVTPALMVMGYDTKVAVGSGLAFVFGTAVIATLKHRDLGQVDYKLGVSMIVGTTAGIEAGKIGLEYLDSIGRADAAVSVIYVLLLGAIGALVTREALTGKSSGLDHEAEMDAGEEPPEIAQRLQSYRVPPMLHLRGDVVISLWVILAVAFGTGLLSGLLGVGGGFIRMPALFYLIGVPVPIAVGTDLFEIVFSGGIGSLLYAADGLVNLGVVAPLLAGSAFGARVGFAATSIVDEDGIKVYFGAMLLAGAVAMAAKQLAGPLGLPVLDTVSIGLILISAFVVSGAIVVSAVSSIRDGAGRGASTVD